MKINGIKKIFLTALAIISAAAVTGCSFSFGDTSDVNERHEELFPDKAAASKQKTSYIAYEFSLDGRGSMKVYVDTSEGHKFELDKGNSGFSIKDKDGTEALHAYCMEEETYKSATAGIENVRNINDRDFFYDKVKDYHSLFSYMADCGLDCGMIMQSTDENAFGLVSFEGTPIEGASDDIYFYQGIVSAGSEPIPTETAVTTIETEAAPTETSPKSETVLTSAAAADKLVSSSLSPEAEELLSELQTDYHKINWGVRYPVSEELPYLVISVAPFMSYDENCLLIGITNLYDRDISFTGSATAVSKDDEVVGSAYVYTGTVGSGNTVFQPIYCGSKLPDGRIKWENCSIETELYESYVPWEADYTLTKNADGGLTLAYSLCGSDGAETVPGHIYAMLIDGSGNVLAFGKDFSADRIPAGEKYEGKINFDQDNDMLAGTADVCMFANSAK